MKVIFFCSKYDKWSRLKFLLLEIWSGTNFDLSGCLAEAFRHNISFVFLWDFITSLKNVVLVGVKHCTVVSWGCWINGCWSVQSAPLFSSSLGHLLRPQWARQYFTWIIDQDWGILASSWSADIKNEPLSYFLVEGREKQTSFVIRSGLCAVARKAHCPILYVTISA